MLRANRLYSMSAHDLRFLQIQVNMEQAKDMPAVELMSKMDSIEFVSTLSTTGEASQYILCLKYSDEAALEEFENSDAFQLSELSSKKKVHGANKSIC